MIMRTHLTSGLAAASILLAALGGPAAAQQPRFDGVTLRVATFGGGWQTAVHDFMGIEVEKRGGKVEYIPSPPRESLAKLIAARGREAPFDVVEMADNTWVCRRSPTRRISIPSSTTTSRSRAGTPRRASSTTKRRCRRTASLCPSATATSPIPSSPIASC
jgi:hypothetical protein